MRPFLFVVIFSLAIQGFAQVNRINQLKQSLLTGKEDTTKVWVLDGLSENYTWSFADTAIMYAQLGLELAQQLNFRSGAAWCMIDLSAGLTTLGNYTSGLHWCFKSLQLFRSLNDTPGICYALSAAGVNFRDQGDYKKSLFYLGEERKMRPTWGDDVICSVYERNNQLDSALSYAKKAYDGGDKRSGLLTVLGAIYAKLNNDSLALAFYKAAIPYAATHNVQIDILDAYNGIANVYWKKNKLDSAIDYANEAIAQRWGRAYPIGQLHSAALLAKIYETQHINDSTLKYLKLTIGLKDSLFNQQKTREAQIFVFNEQLNQQELQQQLQLSGIAFKNRLKIYGLLGSLAVLIIIAAGLWRRNVYKQKSYALLEKQKEEIAFQKSRIEQTLDELKTTQAQLIQQEKMASLGELTAAIAHEIQNPLNFVKNFSEVNNELVEELQTENDIRAIKAISNDIKKNNDKIGFHGQRAAAIVKGMFQHSRMTTGVREPTDINALCEEYLGLAYHGLKAKEKNFEAKIQTDFDNNIGEVSIVPQDIGRVLLNLINNAFYAVNEKAAHSADDYQPSVKIITQKSADNIEIAILDNGPGIPKNIISKIFQPFFTTKPAGQGTGLGLSLSYDIIRAHGGEIRAETRTPEGSRFVIVIPTC